MIDFGSGLNLIKQKCLNPHVTLDKTNPLYLQGIASETIVTLGAVSIPILGKLSEFYVLSDSMGFSQDGILGNKFLKERAVIVNYRDNFIQYEDMKIRFLNSNTIRLKGRTVTPCSFYIANPGRQIGYICRHTSAEGIYFGEATVVNDNGKAYMLVFNTSEEELIFNIPTVELQEYDTCETSNDPTRTRGLPKGLIRTSNSSNFVELSERAN